MRDVEFSLIDNTTIIILVFKFIFFVSVFFFVFCIIARFNWFSEKGFVFLVALKLVPFMFYDP